METLKKKYGLFTAICMVVGIVIGSGIFFKAKDVLAAANGNAYYSILAWIISGLIMVVIATSFGVMATKYEKVNGIVDYAEVTCGKKYAYFVGWFLSLIYYPAMTSVLAWVSARYTLVVFGYIEAPMFALGVAGNSSLNSPECIALAVFYLVLAYFVNTIAPKIAGKFQISSTVIKLIPITFIAVVGTVVGLVNGTLIDNLDVVKTTEFIASGDTATGLFPAICGTIFAYEGWIVATSINAEIKDSKKNLPIALCLGTLIIVVAYTLYNIGILGLADIVDVTANGTTVAFKVFGGAIAAIINILVVISCLGTLNGLMLGCCRGIYSLSARGEGISPETFAQIDKKTNMPHNSAAFALLACAAWFAYFIIAGAGLMNGELQGGIWDIVNEYGFDSSELPIITIYPLYIPILLVMMVKEKDVHPFKRFVLPALSIIGIGVIVAASIIKHKMDNVWYLILFAVIMLFGYIVMKYNEKKSGTLNIAQD
ncbi:MAG: APC family permease [Clostridia bacterium]|nr:APC family permease [Clostridia bacterium]